MDLTKYRKARDRARWLEIIVPIILSIGTSAVVVSWTVSATISSLNEKVSEHDRRLHMVEGFFPGAATDLATLKARQDGDDRLHVEEGARLARIEAKVDAILERGGGQPSASTRRP